MPDVLFASRIRKPLAPMRRVYTDEMQAEADAIAEEDSSAEPPLSDFTQAAAEPSARQPPRKSIKQQTQQGTEAPGAREPGSAAASLSDGRNKVRQALISRLLFCTSSHVPCCPCFQALCPVPVCNVKKVPKEFKPVPYWGIDQVMPPAIAVNLTYCYDILKQEYVQSLLALPAGRV